MATQGNKTAAVNPAIQPAAMQFAVIQSRMNYNPKKSDPIPMTEKMDLSASPNIKNNGESLYSFGTFSIVDAYETNDEKQRSFNEDHGYGYVSNTEAYIVMECRFDDYYEEDWLYEDENMYDYDYVYTDPEYAYLMEYGQMEDTGTSCRMVLPEGMGDSLTQEQMDAAGQDFGPEVVAAAEAEIAADRTEREADMEAALEEKLELPEGSSPTAEGDTSPTAEADAEKPAATTATTATPSTEPAIESKVDLGGAFSGAATPTETAPADLTVAAQPVAPQVAAANNQSYQLRA